MTIKPLELGAPFFEVQHLNDESSINIDNKTIVLNLDVHPIAIREQTLAELQSCIVCDVELKHIKRAVLVSGFDKYTDESSLFERVREHWPSAFQVRNEERLRGVKHYMSPKIWVGNIGFTFYHSGSVPLNVGLHRDHPFCPVPGFREVHTQIVGVGKMQQCREQNIDTLYLEEPMAPGTTHRPMYDEQGNYPWHQYETITPSIFMAVELLPESASLEQLR